MFSFGRGQKGTVILRGPLFLESLGSSTSQVISSQISASRQDKSGHATTHLGFRSTRITPSQFRSRLHIITRPRNPFPGFIPRQPRPRHLTSLLGFTSLQHQAISLHNSASFQPNPVQCNPVQHSTSVQSTPTHRTSRLQIKSYRATATLGFSSGQSNPIHTSSFLGFSSHQASPPQSSTALGFNAPHSTPPQSKPRLHPTPTQVRPSHIISRLHHNAPHFTPRHCTSILGFTTLQARAKQIIPRLHNKPLLRNSTHFIPRLQLASWSFPSLYLPQS